MRLVISGVAAAAAVLAVSSAPAMACGGGLFTGCSPCAQAYVSPCGQPAYGGSYGYGVGYGYGAGYGLGYDIATSYERLPDPSPQYYYVNQGPTYSGPGMYAPEPYYQEATVSRGYSYGYRHRPQYRSWRGHGNYGYARPSYRYGYGYGRSGYRGGYARPGYAPRYGLPPHRMGMHHNMRYGGQHYGTPRYSTAPRGYGAPRHGMHRY
ncbi:hypothetical protein HNR60_002620 [Rhodopseudomonas rhenobacensis]|uniref:Uncharacterized protein n=1 Tax=Rhodopseudomonas rhenobacensis TaxID=87461 RepID=A0A7W7Z4U9_9BRAD|nr:hypothetical protein [Rhodopseudomonas rhenobacensis]MBB5047863.1 hypothetical protein [Rhodopseudomonas rhenobacensis]